MSPRSDQYGAARAKAPVDLYPVVRQHFLYLVGA